MNKIKVLRIIARLNIGGPAIHTILLTEGLSKARFDSLLICGKVGKGEGDMGYYAKEKNINPVFVPELQRSVNFINDLRALAKIYRIIKTKNPDIVHTHTAKAGTLGRLAAIIHNFIHHRKKIKLVHTFHGHVFSGYFNRLNTSIFLFIERFLGVFTSRIITVSESVKNELLLLKICPEEKIKVIHLGFELEKFLSVPFINRDSLNVGIIGRLVPIKNHELFLDAASIILKDNPSMNLRFRIIGDGEFKTRLNDYANRLGIGEQVDFLGWQKDLAQVYSDLDIVALTSINEGTPVSLIEAMASGRAVVATDVGGVRDLLGTELKSLSTESSAVRIGVRGILVCSRQARDFAEALLILLKNSRLRNELAQSGRVFSETHFSKCRLIRDIENLYEEILSCA